MKTFLFLFTIVISLNGYADVPEFEIFYSKGKLDIVKAKTFDTIPVKEDRVTLFKGDKIRLSANAYAVLYYNNGANAESKLSSNIILSPAQGASVELNKAGIYDIDSLVQIVKIRKESNIIASYISFLVKEFKKDNENIEDYHNRYMRAKGGVARELCDIHLLTPAYSEGIVDSTITFLWSSNAKSNFLFAIYDAEDGGKRLASFKTADTVYKLPLNSASLSKGTTYYWSVAHVGEESCMRLPFKALNKDEWQLVKKEIDDIDKTAGLAPNMKSILKAACYENHALYTAAMEQYHHALKSASEGEGIKKLYYEFLARTGLFDQSLSYHNQPSN